MLSILKNELECEFNYDGIKLLQTNNTTKLYKELIVDSNIAICNKLIKSDDIVYINEMTKLSDFVNMNKKSFLLKKIFCLLDKYPIINTENINNICDAINGEYCEELLETNDGDINKVINLFLEFINQNYLNKSLLKLVMENCFDNGKLIIFDQVSWIKISDLYPYINEHKFIVITHDFRDYIDEIKQLETLVIFKNNYEYTEIQDTKSLLMYLEKEMNIEMSKEKIQDFLFNKNTLESVNFWINILKI